MVAQSIPSAAWVTQITADERVLEVAGYTLEPAVLTLWVNRLAESPLLKGQSLSTVKVDRVKPDTVLPGAVAGGQAARTPSAAASMPQATSQNSTPPIWSYALLSSMAPPVAAPKGKP